jgi:hypothetical protein
VLDPGRYPGAATRLRRQFFAPRDRSRRLMSQTPALGSFRQKLIHLNKLIGISSHAMTRLFHQPGNFLRFNFFQGIHILINQVMQPIAASLTAR